MCVCVCMYIYVCMCVCVWRVLEGALEGVSEGCGVRHSPRHYT